MNGIVLCLMLFAAQHGEAVAAEASPEPGTLEAAMGKSGLSKVEERALEASIGKVMLWNERWGGDGAENAVIAEYEKIKKLSRPARTEFFWVLIMHVDMWGGPLEIFEELVAGDDCRDAVIEKLERYVAAVPRDAAPESIAGPKFAGRRLATAQNELHTLRMLKSGTVNEALRRDDRRR